MSDASLESALERMVTTGSLAGAATLVWRGGRIVHRAATGWSNVALRRPLACDDLFRIASMTKPITSVLALMALEEGRFTLQDPITRIAPEFARMRVLRSPTGPLDDVVEAERPITFEDLLTHRSGLTYGDFWSGPIAKAYADTLGGDIDSDVDPDDWISGLGKLPLIDQPGNAFHYGHSTDLLGLLIERMEDAPLGDVLARRLTDPLGMKDTSFAVPKEKRERCVAAYGFDAAGQLMELDCGPGGSFLKERPDDMRYVSGGQGLWSTLDDYLRFARLFVSGGSVDGVQILRRETLALMMSNRLSAEQRRGARLLGAPLFAAGHGFGLGVAVVMDPEKVSGFPCGGSEGSVGWQGGFGGWWQADPNEQCVMLFLAHNMVELDALQQGFGLGVYEAISTFYAWASATDP